MIIYEYIIDNNFMTLLAIIITIQTSKLIKKEDQASFIEDVLEDLKEINEIRIVGLSITKDQLKNWRTGLI